MLLCLDFCCSVCLVVEHVLDEVAVALLLLAGITFVYVIGIRQDEVDKEDRLDGRRRTATLGSLKSIRRACDLVRVDPAPRKSSQTLARPRRDDPSLALPQARFQQQREALAASFRPELCPTIPRCRLEQSRRSRSRATKAADPFPQTRAVESYASPEKGVRSFTGKARESLNEDPPTDNSNHLVPSHHRQAFDGCAPCSSQHNCIEAGSPPLSFEDWTLITSLILLAAPTKMYPPPSHPLRREGTQASETYVSRFQFQRDSEYLPPSRHPRGFLRHRYRKAANPVKDD